MKKSRIIAIMLAFAMTLACMIGCGGKDDSTPESGAGGKKTVVKIGLETKGYGRAHVDNLVARFNEIQSDIEVEVKRVTPQAGLHTNQLALGAKKCEMDIFFTLTQNVFFNQSQANKNHWADLSDVYNSVATGYAESDGVKTVKDLLDPTYVKYFTYTDGKQYSAPYTSGAVGLLYNKTKWDSTNAKLAESGKAELVLPRTTDEMFALFKRIKSAEVKSASENAYAFSYSGVNPYMHFLFNTLWPQYLGQTGAMNFLEGKDENGVYTAEIYNSKARLYAYEVVADMMMQENGYVSTDAVEWTYSEEQIEFLRGSSFFSLNGDWLERETANTVKPGEADVAMIRTPIMSKIVENSAIKADFTGTKAENDAKLSEIIQFIDENYLDADGVPSDADATSLGIAKTTLDFLHHARRVRHALIDFVVVVPEFSAELEEAKEFLKFMYSKEGQDIVLASTYGCAAPMQIDYSQMDYYADATYYSKTRLDLISKALAYGNAYNFPMQYLASMRLYPQEGNFTSYFGIDNPSSARDLMIKEYNENNGTWKDMMAIAGVSND